ncbi:extracellular solute-binding protein [Paenibacillus alkaliterrae]|uniref:ABC transporter substrate-binding protein n=1 Tax=Paenibacillus alkaliterrae TaxID=320909 RepID=UPI001F3AD613|nr:extracellular solute-binding protein [Paenibacillus alkaliterrae]MCF2940843.1 extracellular solute-binding protein [Paenibacillus alkaliterrae]
MRKTSYMLLVAMMAVTLMLSACGGNGNNGNGNQTGAADGEGAASEQKVKLSLLSWNNETEMKPVIDGFTKKYPNITIDFQTAPPVKDYIAKLQTMLLSNSATDVFIMAAENRNELIDGGYALDLTDQPFMSQMTEASKGMFTRDGKTYAFSQAGWVGGIYYNKDLFAKVGVTEEPKTWQEFIDLCLKLKEAGIMPLYDNAGDISTIQGALVASMTLSKDPEYDAKLFTGEKTFADGWSEPLKLWKEGLVDNGIIDSGMIGLTGDQIVNEFAVGNVAMIQGGPWNIPAIEKANPELQFSMMAVPGVEPGQEYYSGAPNVGFAVNSKSKNQEAALKFVEYLSTPEGLELFEKGTGQIITVNGYESKVHPALEKAYKEGLLAGKFYLPMVSWPRHQEALRNQMVVSVQDLLVGKGSMGDVTKALDQKLKEMESK